MTNLGFFLLGAVSVVAMIAAWTILNHTRTVRKYREALPLTKKLRGNAKDVSVAAEYREQIRERLIEGLMMMGSEATFWEGELLARLQNIADAKWWIEQRKTMDDLDNPELVRYLGRLTYHVS